MGKASMSSGCKVIKQVMLEYIIDESGNRIMREYEHTPAVSSGQQSHRELSAAENDLGNPSESQPVVRGKPSVPVFKDADSTTDLKHSEASHSSRKRERSGKLGVDKFGIFPLHFVHIMGCILPRDLKKIAGNNEKFIETLCEMRYYYYICILLSTEERSRKNSRDGDRHCSSRSSSSESHTRAAKADMVTLQ